MTQRTTTTLRSGLLLVVLFALLPLVILSIVQGRVAWRDAQSLTAAQLRANAWIIAEAERDAFVIARQAVLSVSALESVRFIGPGCTEALVSAHRGTVGIINVIRSDASGRVRCSALPFSGNPTFAQDLWWQRAIKIDDVSVSTPTIGRISKKPILVIALPVKTAAGEQDGVITASISLDALRASLEQRSAEDPEALIEIVDARGGVIASNRKVLLALPRTTAAIKDGATAQTPDGAEWLYATAPLRGDDLTIVYAKPRADLLGSALWQVRQSLLLPLLAMALASVAIWMGTDWLVVRWLRKLQALAGQFARGDFAGNRDAYRRAPAEVAALSDDLHVMAETIAARDTALNAALDEKTADRKSVV